MPSTTTAEEEDDVLLEIAGLALSALDPENERLDLVRTMREIYCLSSRIDQGDDDDENDADSSTS
jgi:hypothetical protein